MFPLTAKAQSATQTISGTIKSDAGSIPAGTSVDVVLKENNTLAIEGRTITLGMGGSYSMIVPAGVYTVKFKTDRTLASNVSVGVATSDATANVTLRAGDETNNNVIDVDDEFDLLLAYNCSEGDGTGLYEDYPSADFNYDGIIDVDDLFALLTNFNVSGDVLIPSVVSGSVIYNTDKIYTDAYNAISDNSETSTPSGALYTGNGDLMTYALSHSDNKFGTGFYPFDKTFTFGPLVRSLRLNSFSFSATPVNPYPATPDGLYTVNWSITLTNPDTFGTKVTMEWHLPTSGRWGYNDGNGHSQAITKAGETSIYTKKFGPFTGTVTRSGSKVVYFGASRGALLWLFPESFTVPNGTTTEMGGVLYNNYSTYYKQGDLTSIHRLTMWINGQELGFIPSQLLTGASCVDSSGQTIYYVMTH